MGLSARKKQKGPSAPAPAPSAPPQRRIALLICNGTCEGLPDLDGPARDAERLAAVLADPEVCRFDVRTLVDRGLLEVRREIARVSAEAGEGDTLLLYYSGRGHMDETGGALHLLVADSDMDFVGATTLDADFVLSQLRRSPCRKIVLLVDAPSAGAFFHHNRGIPSGLYAITSCGADEQCADTPEGGAFTLALCEGLQRAAADRDGDGQVTIDDLHAFVKRWLRDEGNRQKWAPSSEGGPAWEGTPQKWEWNVPEPIFLASAPRPVFLSYAREDSAAADALARELEREGFAVWIDREGITSGNWKDRVTHGMGGARALVMLLTPHSLASVPVRKELTFAETKRVPIIPVELGDTPSADLEDWFVLDHGDLHRHALGTPCDPARVRKLADAIRQVRPPQPGVSAPPGALPSPLAPPPVPAR